MAWWNRRPARVSASVYRAPHGDGGLTASARRYNLENRGDVEELARLQQQWQQDILVYADSIGEFKDAGRFVENSFRRMRLFAGYLRSADEEPIGVQDATRPPEGVEQVDPMDVLDEKWATLADDILRDFAARDGGQAALMARLGPLLFFVGEAVVLQRAVRERRPLPGEDPELIPLVWDWEVRSPFEIRRDDRGRSVGTVDHPNQQKVDPILGVDVEPYVERVWRKHWAWAGWADSNARAAVDVLEELRLLGLVARASLRSRAMAGVWKMPSQLDFGGTGVPDGTPGPLQKPNFERALAEAMVAGISDEADPNTVAPLIVTGDAKFLTSDVFGHVEIPRRYAADERAQREDAVRRLGRSIELPQEKVTGVGDVNHWCVDEETEVFTRSGWVRHDALRAGDEVRVLDHDTGLAEWQPVHDIYRADVVDEPMVAVKSHTHSSLTTPNHRWPVVMEPSGRRKWVTTDELTVYAAITTGAPASDLPVVAKYDDAIVELVAWLWTEGHIAGPGVSIAQSHTRNPERVDRIRAALIAAFGTEGWRESVQRNDSSFGGPVTIFHLRQSVASQLTALAPGKRPTEWFIDSLTVAQLALFIDVSCMGDGQHWRSGRRDIWQRNADDLDAYERACILAGYAVSRRSSQGGTRVDALRTTRVRPAKAAYEAQRVGTNGAAIEPVAYTGTIWCPVTAAGSWLARRDGRSFYTGNTGWLVDEDTYVAYMEPLALVAAEAITYGLLRPLMEAEGCPPEVLDRMVAAIDASLLVRRADKGKLASEGYALSTPAVSAEAWRRANGFGDDDAPDSDELAVRAAMSAGIDTALAADILREADIVTVEPAPVPAALVDPNLPDQPMPPSGEERGVPGTQGNEPPAIAAAAGVDIGARLAQIDAVLFARILTLCDQTVTRTLERAGAKLRSGLRRGDATLKAALARAKDAPNGLLGQQVGEAVVADALGPTPITETDFIELEDRFVRWTEAAQEQALRELAAAGTVTEAQLEVLRSRQRQDRDQAWLALLVGLVGYATWRLSHAEDDFDRSGEWDPTGTVRPTLVRESLAIAGGDRIERTGQGGVTRVDGGPAGGPATGQTVRQAFGEMGVPFTGWRWEYGSAYREQPFEPHLSLDGAPSSEWGGYAPGDHGACKCAAVPIVGQPAGGPNA